MKFRNVICAFFLSISLLISCGSEQGNLTSINHEGRYIFGVWNASTTKDAQEVIADDFGENIQTFGAKERIYNRQKRHTTA